VDWLRKAEWEVQPVALSVCRDLVGRYHYAQGGSNTGTYCHGLFRSRDLLRCQGVAWWIPPTADAARASWDGDWQQVLALSRLVLVPDSPKNAASFLLSRSVRLIAQDAFYRCLVTYADTWRGHTGHIYRVSGWEYVGLTQPEEVWVSPTGRMVSRKAGPVTRTRAQMLALGYRSAGKFAKHKFRLLLPERRPVRPRTLFSSRF
jgi:hypothetical protein